MVLELENVPEEMRHLEFDSCCGVLNATKGTSQRGKYAVSLQLDNSTNFPFSFAMTTKLSSPFQRHKRLSRRVRENHKFITKKIFLNILIASPETQFVTVDALSGVQKAWGSVSNVSIIPSSLVAFQKVDVTLRFSICNGGFIMNGDVLVIAFPVGIFGAVSSAGSHGTLSEPKQGLTAKLALVRVQAEPRAMVITFRCCVPNAGSTIFRGTGLALNVIRLLQNGAAGSDLSSVKISVRRDEVELLTQLDRTSGPTLLASSPPPISNFVVAAADTTVLFNIFALCKEKMNWGRLLRRRRIG